MLNGDRWFRQMPGLMILTEEKVVLDRLLKNMRGNDLLQVGGPIDERLIENAQVLRSFFVDANFRVYREKLFIQAQANCLPIQTESMDIVLLMHQLESTKTPIEILQEVYRVLRPNGRLIIVSFNQWGVKQFFYRQQKACSALKIKRILSSLDFDMIRYQTICFRPAFKNKERAKKFLFLETLGQFCLPNGGSVFILLSTKNIMGMTPLVARRFVNCELN